MTSKSFFNTLLSLAIGATPIVSANELGIAVATDKKHYTAGSSSLEFSLSGFNSSIPRNVDVHIGFMAPDSRIYELPDWNTELHPWLNGLTLPQGFDYPPQQVLTVNPAETGMNVGSWLALAALTEPGTLNILALAQYPFSIGSAVVDTGQTTCYNDNKAITCPQTDADFYGQDAQQTGNQPHYTDNGDNTITDHITGLVWQKSPDTTGDGVINADDKFSLLQAQSYVTNLNAQNFGGYNDWRLPSIKELYSLIDFRGTDPSGETSNDTSGLTPFIDTRYFAFGYGDTSAGERVIDAQYASSTRYVSTTMNGDETLFGVNFADGRIKGYGLSLHGLPKTFYLICVRGDSYGDNQFVDNGNGSISDPTTGLMWEQKDSGAGMTWEQALAWAEQKNAEHYLGYNDWRLPNAKELQSIVDYKRSPDTTGSAATDPLFNVSTIVNEAGQSDYPFYWTSTTHLSSNGMAANAVYVAFGRAMGYMNGTWLDVHGAGAQRSDPKTGNPANYPTGHGPQGDAIRIYNYVRLVRGG